MSKPTIYTDAEIESLRKGGKILRACLNEMEAMAAPGVSTLQLDGAAEAFIRDHGGVPAFKGYNGFPGTLCTSINEQCVHGLPTTRSLQEGDIVSIDCGVILDDLYTDACITVPIGPVSTQCTRLLEVTMQALKRGLSAVRGGCRVGDISSAVEQYTKESGFTPIPSLTGHGVGKMLHDVPDIPNVGEAGTGVVLPTGTVVAIEPIVCTGQGQIRESGDGWTICTLDSTLSAHFEHTIVVTDDGHEILA